MNASIWSRFCWFYQSSYRRTTRRQIESQRVRVSRRLPSKTKKSLRRVLAAQTHEIGSSTTHWNMYCKWCEASGRQQKTSGHFYMTIDCERNFVPASKKSPNIIVESVRITHGTWKSTIGPQRQGPKATASIRVFNSPPCNFPAKKQSRRSTYGARDVVQLQVWYTVMIV